MHDIEKFVASLQAHQPMPSVFNPWRDFDTQHDQDRESPGRRAEYLTRFLAQRRSTARLILVGEALGHRGGRFSGLPMTSERLLLRGHSQHAIAATDIVAGPRVRTSRADRFHHDGIAEATSTSTWSALKAAGVGCLDVVFWNAFPFHPMDGRPLSNRTPNPVELAHGKECLRSFKALFPEASLVAMGNHAAQLLAELDMPVRAKLRHPAKGGGALFRDGVRQLVENHA